MRGTGRRRAWPAVAAAAALAAASPASADQPPDQPLSLRRIVLTQGGVGYFEYEATVDGAATLGLDLPLGAVSDVLGSLVVLDAAGSVDGIDLPSAHADAGALAGLPVPRAALDRPDDLLNALQGVVVGVAGATPMTGRVLHAEPPPRPEAGVHGRPGKTRVTLLTDAGMQQFVLEDVTSVQVADPALRARLLAGLAALRGSAATERRHLSVHLQGAGVRSVRLGMVEGAPLWKASYRLVLPPEDAASPQASSPPAQARLQGWAVLENDGLEDWNGVTLSLQSGSPVAFRQAIYQTYHIRRPEIPVDSAPHPLPPVDTRAIPALPPQAPPPAPMPAMRPLMKGLAEPAMAAGPPLATPPLAALPLAVPAQPALVGESGVASSFTLPQPLSLAAGHSASVPFLDRAVSASRVDLLAAGAVHPLAAVRLVNDTGAGLPPGAVTTYAEGDAAPFAGDARLGPFPAGETRVLSFAEDLATTAAWHSAATTTVAGITASGGVLRITHRERTTTTLDLQAPVAASRRVLVEIPRGGGQTLTTEPPLPVARTASAWRLDVALAPGEQRRIVADADVLVSSSVELGQDQGELAAVLDEQGLPQAARDALAHVAGLLRDADAADAARDRLQAQRDAIDQDEARLRSNLVAVPPNDPLHGRLLRALAADEDSLAALAARQRQASDAAEQAHQAVADAIARLSL